MGSSGGGLRAAFTSWRLGSVTLLSVSSGLPLGLVVTAVPALLTLAKVDVKTIGVLTLAQLPWGFKFVWSPLMDRLRPPLFGLRRGWILVCQVLLGAGATALGLLAGEVPVCDPAVLGKAACDAMTAPPAAMVTAIGLLSLFISFASASQDIAYDAYAVEVLEKHEHGAAVGARSAAYRLGMWLSGNIAITLAPFWGWKWTLISQALVYAALLPLTVLSPEPRQEHALPKTLGEAVWKPFVGFLGRPRALEIAGFVLLYRLADSIAGALVSTFLIQRGFSAFDVGVVRGGVGVVGTLLGTFLGGLLTSWVGVGRALWICGVLQIISNVGYAVVAVIDPGAGALGLPFTTEAVVGGVTTQTQVTVSFPLQAAIFIETACGGMGWGAFGVLLLRLTDKRFSATQYALFSSLVGLARTFVGPPAGVLADALGWAWFFLLSMAFGLPGMWMLRKFVPWGEEPKEVLGEALEPLPPGPPWPRAKLWAWGAGAALSTGLCWLCLSALMLAVKQWRAKAGFDFGAAFHTVALPQRAADAVDLTSAVIFGLVGGMAVAAYLAARGQSSARLERRA